MDLDLPTVFAIISRLGVAVLIGGPVGLAGYMLARLYRRHRRRSNPSYGRLHPQCKGCDYLLRGLTSPLCPECGRSLVIPGAISAEPRRTRRLTGTTHVLAPALIAALLWWVACDLLTSPMLYNFHYRMAQPHSQAYQSVRISAGPGGIDMKPAFNGHWRRIEPGDIQVVHVNIRASGNYQQHVVHVDDVGQTYASLGLPAAHVDDFSSDTLRQWFQQLDITGDGSAFEGELEAATAVVDHLLADQEPDRAVAAHAFRRVRSTYGFGQVELGPGFWGRAQDLDIALLYAILLAVCAGLAGVTTVSLNWFHRRAVRNKLILDDPPIDPDRMALRLSS